MQLWFVMMITFLLTFVFILWIIDIQKTKKLGQIEREEGLATHKCKNHTPTMAGIAFIGATVLLFTVALFVNPINLYVYFLLVFPMICYGLLGLYDDLLIVMKHKNDGINPSLKFFLQIVIAAIYFAFYLKFNFDTTIDLHFTKIDLKFIYGIFILLSFAGFSNAANLTDGIDGLLAGTILCYLFAFYHITHSNDVRIFIAILVSALIAFLYFNLPKAQVFMGNVGSLALGGVIVSIATLMKLEVLMFVVGGVYIIEALSVILQVGYFKLTKGKRLFKMAPIHHHFEIVFNSEIKTLILFYAVAFILSAFGIWLYYQW